jgi:hypothetical protein
MTILEDIFSYGYRGGGKYVLLICTVISAVAQVASYAPAIGWLAWWLVFGYYCATYFKVIETSATGSNEAPDFPEISSMYEDVVVPAFKVIAVSAVCFGPEIIYEIFAESKTNPAISMALKGFGFVFFPMAMMAVACLGYLGAMSPHIVLPAIFRAGGLYWLAVFLLAMLDLGFDYIDGLLNGIPFLNVIVLTVIGAYVFLTNGRILGVIYRERQEEMGWN